ncbi:MAG: coproporphyrinogen III oxidase family protein [Planctomycetes bacterium]|nr:coproporphyrinogen III oxidase family protein [Planctomycetota bacterium]
MTEQARQPDEGRATAEKTRAGNYFVANYPPFSFWKEELKSRVEDVLVEPPRPNVPLGLYVHVPFCRQRCDFCYFKVYTDKNASAVTRYLDGVLRELDLYKDGAAIRGRKPTFVYFGGGTPSYLSSDQLEMLFEGLRDRLPWDDVEEVAFECEPGTLSEKKAHTLKRLGVTRLSFGIENFDPGILERNNRAHRGEEIYRVYGYARDAGFPLINIDLIAGMVGETDANWQHCIAETLKLAPDMVTIYLMEIPYNTTIYQRMRAHDREEAPVADWATKRRWVDEAFRAFEQHGYRVSSTTTALKGEGEFVYRDRLWKGADLLSLGVSSFSHLSGVHYQNLASFEGYLESVERGVRPIQRAYALSPDEQLIREFVLQLKLGRLSIAAFRDKFGVDVRERFREPLETHRRDGMIDWDDEHVFTSREGLFQIDRLLWDFFLPEHVTERYA